MRGATVSQSLLLPLALQRQKEIEAEEEAFPRTRSASHGAVSIPISTLVSLTAISDSSAAVKAALS